MIHVDVFINASVHMLTLLFTIKKLLLHNLMIRTICVYTLAMQCVYSLHVGNYVQV